MELFELGIIPDNPIYEGFATADFDKASVLGREDFFEDINPWYNTDENNRYWSI